MTVESSESRIAVCECGANISLVHKISGQCFGLDTLSELLASVIDRYVLSRYGKFVLSCYHVIMLSCVCPCYHSYHT